MKLIDEQKNDEKASLFGIVFMAIFGLISIYLTPGGGIGVVIIASIIGFVIGHIIYMLFNGDIRR